MKQFCNQQLVPYLKHNYWKSRSMKDNQGSKQKLQNVTVLAMGIFRSPYRNGQT